MDHVPNGQKVLSIDWESGYTKSPFTQKPVPWLGPSFNQETPKDLYGENVEEESVGCCSSVVQCSQETSFSGLKYIGGVDSGGFRRLFWLLVVLGAFFGLAFQLVRSTEKFIDRGTNTNLKYVPQDELDFPSVTFCNTNMFRLQQLITFYGSWEAAYLYGLRYIRQLFPQLGISVEEFNPELIDDKYPGGLSLYDFVVSSAHSVETMIILCEFRGQRCGAENFTTTITNFGVCFTFNSAVNNESLSVDTAGQRQGLSLVLYAEEKNAVAAPRENLGFKMLVHPRGEVPNLQDYGIELQPGTHTPVRLDVTKIKTLPKPYGECGKKPLKYFDGDYTESKCFLECETDYIVSNCGCRSFYMPGNATYCSPTQLIYCFYNASDVFAANTNKLCSCPEACEETIYKPTISQSTFPSNGVATTFFARGNYGVPASAFAETVAESASSHIHTLYAQVAYSCYYEMSMLNNTNGTTFLEMFPDTIEGLSAKLMRNVFGNINFDLFIGLADLLFYEIVVQNISLSGGGVIYFQQKAYHTTKWLESGIYKQSVADAFEESGEYLKHNVTLTFEDFVDEVYDEFGFEEIFHIAFPHLYNATLDVLLTQGYDVVQSIDLTRMTTNYMSKNILHADVFFGDLKVEQITEQPSYELFQFVCDLGGALGLFFGASLLSFIETADFCFSKPTCCGSKKDKERSKSQVKVQPDTYQQ